MENTVTIHIPFTYTLGERGRFTNKILKTVEDCEAEFLEEVKEGLEANSIYYEVIDDDGELV